MRLPSSVFYIITFSAICVPLVVEAKKSSLASKLSSSSLSSSPSVILHRKFGVSKDALDNGSVLLSEGTKPPKGDFLLNSRGGEQRIISLSTKVAVIAGSVLAFNSGYVNGICLSGILSSDNTKQASAAVTGAWTNSALGLSSGNTDQFYFNAKCILSYMFGSIISGSLVPNPIPYEVPLGSGLSFLIGSIMLFFSSRAAVTTDGSNKNYLYFAAVANGIQNSITSVMTSNLVRTSHFSGITSDVGTFVGQNLRGNNTNRKRLMIVSTLALSFWMGGFISFTAVNELANSSLLFSSALYLAIGSVIILNTF